MRNKSDKLPKQKKMIIVAILSVLVIVISFVCIEKIVRIFSEEMGKYYCKSQISQSISQSVRDTMEQTGAQYSDLSVKIYDEEGNFISAELCSKNINILQSMIVSDVNDKISGLSDSEIKISAGTLSGIYLFNGKGPKIKLKLLPVGSAQTELKSEFESAGINQTCHKISLDIKAEVRAIYPTGSETVTVSMNCILVETVIAGEVPDGLIYR